jgi:hypothetical protein
MTAMKHTNSPWQWNEENEWIENDKGEPIVYGGRNGDLAVSEADRNLILAAPDLLAFVRQHSKRDPVFAKGMDKQIITAARALVDKAEGRP